MDLCLSRIKIKVAQVPSFTDTVWPNPKVTRHFWCQSLDAELKALLHRRCWPALSHPLAHRITRWLQVGASYFRQTCLILVTSEGNQIRKSCCWALSQPHYHLVSQLSQNSSSVAFQLSIVNKIFVPWMLQKEGSSLTNMTNMIILSPRKFKGMCRFRKIIRNWRVTLYITVWNGASLMPFSLDMSKYLFPRKQASKASTALSFTL